MARDDARGRAALALGAFDTPESRAALESCAAHAELGPYCNAALYRLTREERYLDALAAAPGGPAEIRFRIGPYLLRHAESDAVHRLLDSLPPEEPLVPEEPRPGSESCIEGRGEARRLRRATACFNSS